MLQLNSRSYTNGQSFRPKPVIIERPESHLLVIATPWGPMEAAQRAAEVVVEQFELLAGEDATSAIEVLPSVSSAANRLRIGVMLANQDLYQGENAKILKAAVEMTALHYDHGVLSWVHIGGPHLLLDDGQTLHPLAYETDLSWQGQRGPLFSQALGMEEQVPLHIGSQRLPVDSQLLLLAHSRLPRVFLKETNWEMDKVVDALITDSPDSPFWVGIASLNVS